MLPDKVFFNNFLDDFESATRTDKMMRCDIYEKDGQYILEIEIPGFKKEDINMEFNNGYLKIYAEKNSDKEETNDKKYLRRERHLFEKCERQFYVGNILEDQIKAKFKNSILKITLPKEEKKETKKLITIED